MKTKNDNERETLKEPIRTDLSRGFFSAIDKCGKLFYRTIARMMRAFWCALQKLIIL